MISREALAEAVAQIGRTDPELSHALAPMLVDGRLAPAEHKKFVEAEINKWGPAIKAAGQYAD